MTDDELGNFIPRTLTQVKRLAVHIKRRDGIKHSAALETAARQARYKDYFECHHILSGNAGPRAH